MTAIGSASPAMPNLKAAATVTSVPAATSAPIAADSRVGGLQAPRGDGQAHAADP